MRGVICAAVIACGLIAAPSSAQSLGDLARKEEARRATGKKSVKTFTNADLAPSEIPTPAATAPVAPPAAAPAPAAATPPCDPATSADKCAAADAAAKPAAPGSAEAKAEAAQLEANWRRNADDLRRQLEKARSDYAAVAKLAEDASKTPGERAAPVRVAEQQLKLIEMIERKWVRLEQQAAELKLPREWLEPRPTLSTRIPQ